MTDFKVGDTVKLVGRNWEGEEEYGVGTGSIHELVSDDYDGKLGVIDKNGDTWFIHFTGYDVELVESTTEEEPEVTGENPDLPVGFFSAPKSATQELEEKIERLEGEIENLKSAQSYGDSQTASLQSDFISSLSRLNTLANDVDKDREKATAETLLLSHSVDDRFAGLNHPLKALILAVGSEKFSEAELTIARLAGVDALTGTK